MKTAALKNLRRKLAAGECTYGMWVTLESPSVTEMAVAIGLDWIVIDAEHGHLDWGDILGHVRATVRSGTVALLRIAELNGGAIKRALDIGVDGVVIPWVETVEQLEEAVAFARYPPVGKRGIGGERATGWGSCMAEHVAEANENILVVPFVETVTGGQDIEALVQVPGVEVFFVGAADYSSSAGYPGQWQGPGVAEELLRIKDTVQRAGKYCGAVTTGSSDLIERREQGFSLVAVGLDGWTPLNSLKEALAAAGAHRKVVSSFIPQDKKP